ncbi:MULTISPECIES: hypothetical protein [Streptomyces]|uniref:hypothetical protein n=1 Tax=Streptomyces TaxID=1883 RepID=UPI00345F2C19
MPQDRCTGNRLGRDFLNCEWLLRRLGRRTDRHVRSTFLGTVMMMRRVRLHPAMQRRRRRHGSRRRLVGLLGRPVRDGAQGDHQQQGTLDQVDESTWP